MIDTPEYCRKRCWAQVHTLINAIGLEWSRPKGEVMYTEVVRDGKVGLSIPFGVQIIAL